MSKNTEDAKQTDVFKMDYYKAFDKVSHSTAT
jgi:hypothetical protein